jgi:HAD superfamily hydrolase (TIGR01549 family)
VHFPTAGSRMPPGMTVRPRAILFDLDGTLTEPLLDFDLIRREMGIGQRPILEALAEMDQPLRSAAEAVLLRHERRAAEESTLNQGCAQLLARLEDMGIATAIITRNSMASVQQVLRRHGLRFGALIAREDGPVKPDAWPLLEACRRLGVSPAEAWMVGDGEYDILAAQAAGVRSVWLSHGRPRPFAAEPWRTVADLKQLTELLGGCLLDGQGCER